MSLLLIDGFEEDSEDRIVLRSGTIHETGTVRSGSRSIQTGNTLSTGGTCHRIPLPPAEESDTLIIGSAVYFGGSDPYIHGFSSDNAATRHVSVRALDATRQIIVYRGGTQIGLSDPFIYRDGAWNYIETRVVLSDTIGEVQVRINNSTVINVTGINTSNGGTKTVFDTAELMRSATSNSGSLYDDVYLLNNSGPAPYNTFLGDIRIVAQLPNGNGTYSQFTGTDADSVDNYLHIDESGTPSTVDYVESTITGDKDSYTFSDVGITPTANILAVQVSAHAQKSDAGARSFRMFHRESGTDTDGSTNVLGTSWRTYDWLHTVNPRTSTDWSTTTVNDAEWGVEARP